MGAGASMPPRVRRLAAWIEAGAPAGADTLDVVTRELVPILGSDQVVAYGLDSQDGSTRPTFLRSTHGRVPEVKRRPAAVLERRPTDFGHHAPCSPPAGVPATTSSFRQRESP
jgi:hypothetical protein